MVGGTAAGVIYAVIPSTSQISQWEPGSGGGVRVRACVRAFTLFRTHQLYSLHAERYDTYMYIF